MTNIHTVIRKISILTFIIFNTSICLAEESCNFFENVSGIAEKLSKETYKTPSKDNLKSWLDITYDEYKKIRFKTSKSIWRGESDFELQMFHAGFLYTSPVVINSVEGCNSKEINFSPEYFTYPKSVDDLDKKNVGFAGFRIHYPLHTNTYKDELGVFVGATYFKFLGRTQKYGLSARGLAIDTAATTGEEFPVFNEYWIEKPPPNQQNIVIYALLDSKRITGAYRFEFFPKDQTVVEVKVKLFPREGISELGIAPLTSMFFYGENSHLKFNDFRPEVHDSDGLLIHNGSDEWIWRPLATRDRLEMSSFFDSSTKGFGLIQRDLQFSSYQDLEALYHKRPSYWVEATSPWPSGRVVLVEIPTNAETNDNIVAYWDSDQPAEKSKPIELQYKIKSYLATDQIHNLGKVNSTRITYSRIPGTPILTFGDSPTKKFVVDFNGGSLPLIGEDQPVEGLVSCSSGKIENIIVQSNSEIGGWRLFFDYTPEGDQPSDIRAFLRLRSETLTETWSYLWE